MSSDYKIEIEAEIPLPDTPIALATLAFASPRRYLAVAFATQNHVSLISDGTTFSVRDIQVGEQPCAITRGSAGMAYIACQGSRTLDVINRDTRVKQIQLPGRPFGATWNGSFKRGKQRILVTCELDSSDRGFVCAIDEETLEVCSSVPVGHRPRGICLDLHRRLLFVANFSDDSVTILDETGTQNLHTLPTAGRPSITQYSWADPDHLMISLQAGGVLQRMDASVLPPQLSGLIPLKRRTNGRASFAPSGCLPLGQDNLWIVADQASRSIALVRSENDVFEQIDCFEFDTDKGSGTGFGPIAIATPGLPARIYVADPANNQLLVVRLIKTRSVLD